jgi:hypothetical protein
MTTYHGRADIKSIATTTQIWNEVYTSIIQFMSGSNAQALGIQMIESNRGASGRGLDYWDTGANSGQRTWAVFRFLSSSFGQFDLAIYANSGSSNNDPFQPGNFTTDGTAGGNGVLGLAVAVHPSGSTTLPWNGSSGSFVSGTAGSPVWKADASGRLAVFPRVNSSDGAFPTTRKGMICLFGSEATPVRCHLIVSQDSFSFFWGASDTQSYKTIHFGSFTPRSGTSIDVPYFMFCTAGAVAPQLYTSVYGSTTTLDAQSRDGGIGHPTSLSGSKIVTLVTVGNAEIDTSIGSFNPFVNSGSFDVLPIYVAIKDSTDVGILGIANNIALGFNMTPHSVTPNSGSACFGLNTAGNLKVVVPWSGLPPGSTILRTGREW